jgi:hypothetical protein
MSRIALLAALFASALLAACTATTNGYNAKTESDQDRRFIWGIPQNDR